MATLSQKDLKKELLPILKSPQILGGCSSNISYSKGFHVQEVQGLNDKDVARIAILQGEFTSRSLGHQQAYATGILDKTPELPGRQSESHQFIIVPQWHGVQDVFLRRHDVVSPKSPTDFGLRNEDLHHFR